MTRRNPPHVGPTLGTYEALLEEVAIRRGITKLATRQVVSDFIAALSQVVWEVDHPVEVPGLGVFRIHEHAGRRIRHPATKRLMRLKPTRMAKLKVASSWRVR